MKNIALLLVLVLTVKSTAIAQKPKPAEIVPIKVSDNIYMLKGKGGNIGLWKGPEANIMIDDQFADMADKIKAASAKLGVEKIDYLLNTHWHGDHTGGNVAFQKQGAKIIAHHNVRRRLSTDQVMKAFSREVKASPKEAWPVITFKEEMMLHFNGESVLAFHIDNAHTDGDAILYWPESKVIHAGDIYFEKTYPFVDVGSGGSLAGIIEAVERMIHMSDDETKVIPGHGDLSNKAGLQDYHSMLTGIQEIAIAARAKGLTSDQCIEQGLTKAYDEKWGQGWMKPSSFLKAVFNGMDRK